MNKFLEFFRKAFGFYKKHETEIKAGVKTAKKARNELKKRRARNAKR